MICLNRSTTKVKIDGFDRDQNILAFTLRKLKTTEFTHMAQILSHSLHANESNIIQDFDDFKRVRQVNSKEVKQIINESSMSNFMT